MIVIVIASGQRVLTNLLIHYIRFILSFFLYLFNTGVIAFYSRQLSANSVIAEVCLSLLLYTLDIFLIVFYPTLLKGRFNIDFSLLITT